MEGVDDTVDLRSNLGGVRRKRFLRGVRTTPKPGWCHIICIRVWWEVVRDILRLRGVTGFTHHTYPTRRLCSSRWKLPIRVQRMESCDNMWPSWVIYVHMAHPNTTKYKSPCSYPLSTPVEGVDDTVDFWSTVGGFRRNRGLRGVGTSPKHRWCPNICIRLWW